MPKFWLFGKSSCKSLEYPSEEQGVCTNSIVSEACSDTMFHKGNSDVPISKEDLNVALNLKGSNEATFSENYDLKYFALSLPSEAIRLVLEDDSVPFGDKVLFHSKEAALSAAKKYKGSRFKSFNSLEDAFNFITTPAESLCQSPHCDAASKLITPLVSNENPDGSVLSGEKTSPFKFPKSQETVKLRKAIERGDLDYVKATVFSNPRYLISNGDTPTILMEGYRYNALHVSAKFKQAAICEFILNTIQNPKFMEILYEDDSEAIKFQRIKFVTDLYLNTPDKRACETPLHFASKFGCLTVVEILASHPTCDKSITNREGKLAKEIICERCPSSSLEIKKKIEEAFEGKFYVPMLRYENNSSQPIIGEPCLPEGLSCASSIPQSPLKCLNSELSIMAIAGPMSPKEAKQFYKHWKTPPVSRYGVEEMKQLSQIRLCDREKGLERIGRVLAHTYKTQWKEYWPALGAWCDLSSAEGLETLEVHLRSLYNDSMQMQKSVRATSSELSSCSKQSASAEVSYDESPSSCASSNSSGGISSLCLAMNKLHFSDCDSSVSDSPDICKKSRGKYVLNDSKLFTPCAPDSQPLTDLSQTSIFSSYGDHAVNDFFSVVASVIKCLKKFILEFAINFEIDESSIKIIHFLLKENVHSSMKSLIDVNSNEQAYIHCDVANETFEQIKRSLTVHEMALAFRCLKSYFESDASSDEEDSSQNDLLFNYSQFKMLDKIQWQHSRCILSFLLSNMANDNTMKKSSCSCPWNTNRWTAREENVLDSRMNIERSGAIDIPVREENVFFTPPTSPLSSSAEEEAVTPDEGLEIYVRGLTPSKEDLDMIRAIDEAKLNPAAYPHVFRWKHLIDSKHKSQKGSDSPLTGRHQKIHDDDVTRILTSPPPQHPRLRKWNHSTPAPSQRVDGRQLPEPCNLSRLYDA